ncbi:addiction module toxin, HicA family [Candidatus Poribacteria bacterium]|nr:addiction module toxin, HicA family [Candidatus Poribacteria bacterium]MYG08645.1 addiction module toxin, HicA family [Candidatus Poribacteria bacterium]MYK20679.1 addiction module toxin, HicA family [Candidatus Poribacteria bacterium]
MPIDYRQLRSLTARKLIRALKQDGFYEVRRKGSLRFFAHPDGRTTTIHLHKMSQTFAPGTLRSIIGRQARWTETDIERLGLL